MSLIRRRLARLGVKAAKPLMKKAQPMSSAPRTLAEPAAKVARPLMKKVLRTSSIRKRLGKPAGKAENPVEAVRTMISHRLQPGAEHPGNTPRPAAKAIKTHSGFSMSDG